jgi:hypothetical protein
MLHLVWLLPGCSCSNSWLACMPSLLCSLNEVALRAGSLVGKVPGMCIATTVGHLRPVAQHSKCCLGCMQGVCSVH